ncbi:hypothetical protein SUGI_0134560 [Cryptomeria japonica]|nr:hypothetical protein SUGI_0134560 [Cryptomeria japonica]
MFVRFVQLILSRLPTNLRFLVFYLLSNFDNRYLPCSISDFKVKTTRTKVFYTTDNTVLNCPVKRITQLPFDSIDTSRGEFHFKAKAFRVEITKEPSNNELVKFKLELKEVLYDLVKASFTMTQDSFKSYIGCWKLLEEGSAGLVRAVEKGMLIKNINLFGFKETINLFWGSKVNVYEVEVEEEYRYLVAGNNNKNLYQV